MVLASSYVDGITVIEIMIAIILAWIITSLWFRFIDNLAHGTFGLDRKSTLHTFIVAMVVTIILIAFIYSVRSTVTNMILGETVGLERQNGSSESFSPTSLEGGIRSTMNAVRNFDFEKDTPNPPKEKDYSYYSTNPLFAEPVPLDSSLLSDRTLTDSDIESGHRYVPDYDISSENKTPTNKGQTINITSIGNGSVRAKRYDGIPICRVGRDDRRIYH